MDGKGILDALIALILYIVFAIIYFIILCFIVKVGAGLVGGDWDVAAESLALAASILTAGTLIAGGGMMDVFKKP
ncbi:MAG: hypothetical protein FWC29_02055 [Methanomassiliicoccaceae archaeon]|nr:hypothetical protein [Methanomassiliicoccaceae archaeon]